MITNLRIRRIILFLFTVLIFALVCDILSFDFRGKIILLFLLSIISGVWLIIESIYLAGKLKRTNEIFPFKKVYFPVYQVIPSFFLLAMAVLIRKDYPDSAFMFMSIAIFRLIQVVVYKLMNIFGLMVDLVRILENSDLVVDIPFELIYCITIKENIIEWITIRKKNGPVIYLDKMRNKNKEAFLRKIREDIKNREIKICKPSDLGDF